MSSAEFETHVRSHTYNTKKRKYNLMLLRRARNICKKRWITVNVLFSESFFLHCHTNCLQRQTRFERKEKWKDSAHIVRVARARQRWSLFRADTLSNLCDIYASVNVLACTRASMRSAQLSFRLDWIGLDYSSTSWARHTLTFDAIHAEHSAQIT